MKILLSAFACEPGQGSEEGVGWNMAMEAAKSHQVWVLTRGFCRHTIEPYLEGNPIPNLHFVYFEPFGWSEDWRGRQGLLTLHYYLWQIWAYFVGRKLHRSQGFDAVRHLTYVRYWNPSFLALLPVPFVWGTVGGGESAPPSFWRGFSRRGRIYEIVRDLARFFGECDPFVALTARRSAIALATTADTAAKLSRLGAKKVQVFSAVGLTEAEIETLGNSPSPPDHIVRFLSVGRLIHWKGIHLALQAFQQANVENAEYWLVGDGVERQRLQDLSTQLGLQEKVKFWGVLPREETLAKMGECHVLLHPSLHESGGFVCAEMMAAGRPVICLNLGGSAVHVTAETGILVEAKNPEQAIADMAAAIVRLGGNSQLRDRLGQGGKKRMREVFAWSVKGQFFDRVYQSVSDR
ncbi:MAG: glycosyltransferase [Cyanobacteria bacterium SBLK]|nr:glycosyltransferase [Cyanobacteria bacterium SBLK]